MQHLLSVFALCICISLVGCRPLHIRQKRTTKEDIVGDLTAEEAGILNQDCKLLFKIFPPLV